MTLSVSLDQPWKKASAAIEDQLAAWVKRTGPGDIAAGIWPELPENRSQVARLDKTIRQLLDAARTREAASDLQTALLRRDGVYATALVWEFFRSRLAQRDSPDLEGPLLFADDLAWSCWAPAMAAAGHAVREPPLGAFGARENPALWPRNKPFLTQSLPPPWDRHFQDAVRSLPVPVFELPWSQVRYLPAYATVAHEVGHAVDADLDAGPALDAALSGKLGPWPAWRSETLADLWGLLGCGAGYAAVLAGVLAKPAESLAAERIPQQPKPGSHPPALLRMSVLFALARAIELDLSEVEDAWRALVGDRGATAFDGECDEVAAVLTSSWPALGSKRPQDVLPPPSRADLLEQAVNVVIHGTQDPKDPRLLAAGAAWAWFSRTDEYAGTDDTDVIRRYVDGRTKGVRGPDDGLEGTRPDATAADAASVDDLLKRLDEMLAGGAP